MFSVTIASKSTQTLSLTFLNFSTTLLLRRFVNTFFTGGDLTPEDQAVATAKVQDMVATASGAESMSLEQGGPMLSCVSNLAAAPVNYTAQPELAPGSNPNGAALMGKMENMGDSMLGANVPGKYSKRKRASIA